MRQEKLLAAHALRTPEKTALVTGGRRISYVELHESAQAMAAGLHHCGLQPGDRVLVYLPNGLEFIQTVYAAFSVGAIVVPVNTRLTAKEVAYFAADSRPALMVFHSDHADALAQVSDELAAIPKIVVGERVPGARRFEDVAAPSDEPLPEVPLQAEDCMIMYTSGTTGKPKGAVLTHANFIVQHAYLNAIEWGIGASDRFLVTTPLAHRTGLARMMNALCLGATLVVMERFDPLAAIDLIEREQVTALGMVPTVARMLLPHLEQAPKRCASLRHVIVTGEAFPVELKRRLIELLPAVRLHSFFAMTEVGSVSSLEHEEQFTHPTSVGRPTPGIEVKLVDDKGREVSVGDAGEMLVRAGIPGRFTTMRGYYNRPEETAATIVDGWVHTGDMARFDADGYLYIVDRKKDMVLSGGFNIYTKEVEQALLEHEAVLDVAVVGAPDPVYGEAVVAYVETRPGCSVTREALAEHTKSRIASYKKPKHVFFVDSLPRNPLGKILKNELRERAAVAVRTEEPAC
ncbi:MAG TPA: AMP-binding protein [Noviherbaspirillum sp.]|nr:AMP-binding protein [Noviherbaspirillum sp.]